MLEGPFLGGKKVGRGKEKRENKKSKGVGGEGKNTSEINF